MDDRSKFTSTKENFDLVIFSFEDTILIHHEHEIIRISF